MPDLLSRRQLIAQGAGAAAGLALLGHALPAMAAPKAKKLRHVVSCETYSLRDLLFQKKLTLEGVPDLLKEANVTGITWNDMFFPNEVLETCDKQFLGKLNDATKRAGRVTTGFIMEGMLCGDDASREAQIKSNLQKLKVAAFLGAPVVRMNLGGLGNDQQDATLGVERVIGAFKRMLPACQDAGVRISMENHGGVSGTAENLIAIIKGTDPKWVGSCLDFGNWPADVRLSSCQKMAPYAFHCHAKATSFNEQGEDPNIDFKTLIGYLKKAKYKGAASIEFEGEGDPIVGVKKTRDLIRRYYTELG
ncbi:MAG TPA: sugar phosphate isomerase/epimerase family protein [Armatimonadota bacterium]|jgi:sugar phosphate isomerase/epimerase